MSEHVATVHWQRDPAADFAAGRYSRQHEWQFDGGAVVSASASPHAVRAPWSTPSAVDPEEAFVAALASCHMLWFLALAAQRGFVVDAYADDASAWLEDVAPQRQAITRIGSGARASPSPAPDPMPKASTPCTTTPTRAATSPTR